MRKTVDLFAVFLMHGFELSQLTCSYRITENYIHIIK